MAYFENGVTTCVVNKGVPDGLNAEYQHLASALAKLAKAAIGEEKINRIETSFYGNLSKYAKWMTAPICAGLTTEFDPYLDAKDAQEFLASRGVELVNRPVDDAKNYGESITIDLVTATQRVSVRGTITEGKMMISRVNDFDRLYLLSGKLGEKGINIIDIRAPQNRKTGNSLAVIKICSDITDADVKAMAELVDAVKAFKFNA